MSTIKRNVQREASAKRLLALCGHHELAVFSTARGSVLVLRLEDVMASGKAKLTNVIELTYLNLYEALTGFTMRKLQAQEQTLAHRLATYRATFAPQETSQEKLCAIYNEHRPTEATGGTHA